MNDAKAILNQSELTQENLGAPAGPCAMVIFGAGGDLTKRKLMPALYNLAKGRMLPDNFAIIGVSLEKYTTDEIKDRLGKEVREYDAGNFDAKAWDWFTKRIYYLSGDFKDPKLYQDLKNALAQADKDQGTLGNYLFYTATSPVFFAEVAKQLGAAGLTNEEVGSAGGASCIEKPFGHDLQSAIDLNHALGGGGSAKKPDLPHRSLSGQGNRSEHFWRSRFANVNFGASVEPALRRSRASNGGRGTARCGDARRLLRHRRRPA